jgi:endonuclease/exonuclease/phosphatase family metal-dependent hydrolase
MIHHIEIFFAKFRRLFSRSEWGVRLLRLPRSEGTATERGLVMIQIDGLAKRHLETAIAQGRMPFLAKLQSEEDYHLHSFYSGMPSSTPAVQGELFYGVPAAVPAFHFVDHETGEFSAMFDPSSAAKREAIVSKKAEQGLLEGGSSYSNVYTGGAEESHFCASSIGWSNFVRQSVSPLKLAVLFVSNLFSFVRVVALMVVEFVIAVIDAVRGIIGGRDLGRELTLVPARVAFCVLLRELIAIFVRMDVARGLPIIHANLLAYDEQAHRRGPDSGYAQWALGGVDKAIDRIVRAARRSTRREYDVWIYSDHGQERSVPYQRLTGMTISDAVKQAVQATGLEETLVPDPDHREEASRIVSPRTKLPFRLPPKRVPLKGAKGGFRVVARGPIGNIYFQEKLSVTQKEAIARELTQTGEVPFVLFTEPGERVIAIDCKGRYVFTSSSGVMLGHDHPFLNEVTEDLASLCFHEDAGQLLICGYHVDQKSLSFAMENGSHAGPGQDETHAFALLPKDVPLETAVRRGHMRPIDLRHAALHFLGRRELVEPFYIKSARAEREKHTLRIMTYNVHSCLGMDGKLSPKRIARVIARYAPDIVCLQELDVQRLRSNQDDQAHLIAEHLEMEFHFHPAVHLEEERYGDAILTHYPLRVVQVGHLPSPEGARAKEPRGALWVEIETGNGPVQVINTHLGLSPNERALQIDALLGEQWMGSPDCTGPLVFCGDFNLIPSSKLFRRIAERFPDAQESFEGHVPLRTLGTRLPIARIDHIFMDRSIHVVAVEVPSSSLTRVASDHLPVIADVRLSSTCALSLTPHASMDRREIAVIP